MCDTRNDPLCLNCQMAYREKGEYYLEKREILLQKYKERYEINKEILLPLQRKYYHEHKEENKPKRKQYTIDNKQHKSEYDREYRDINKEKIRAANIKYNCGCGGTYDCKHKTRHEKSKKHQAWMVLQPEE